MKLKNTPWHVATNYLESIKRDYHTKEFGFSSWNPPNSTFTISNHLPAVLRTLSPTAASFFWDCVDMLKRNHDPAYAVLVHLDPKELSHLNKRTYYRYIKELLDAKLLLRAKESHYIVNPLYCHKLFKPKFDIDE